MCVDGPRGSSDSHEAAAYVFVVSTDIWGIGALWIVIAHELNMFVLDGGRINIILRLEEAWSSLDTPVT